jgi:hypothetical protein
MEWTLLALGTDAPDTSAFESPAEVMKADLKIIRLPQQALLDLYEAPLVLIRPDQIVAWRGATANGAMGILAQATGRNL